MSVKTYGIYLAYPPLTDLRYEGLGRHLAAFLQASLNRSDIRFIIACPSWLKADLLQLCENENIPLESFDLLMPGREPFILRCYKFLTAMMKRVKHAKKPANRFLFLKNAVNVHKTWLQHTLATQRNMFGSLFLMLYAAVLSIFVLPFYVLFILSKLMKRYQVKSRLYKLARKALKIISQPLRHNVAYRLFQFMEEHESSLLIEMINASKNVNAWYSPTAFWPSFNKINAPRLMCVPDVVLKEFPVNFAEIGGERYLQFFLSMENTIVEAQHIVVYSNHIKWARLVNDYGIHPDRIDVVQHAPNNLNRWVTVTGFPDNERVARDYAEKLLMSVMLKKYNTDYVNKFSTKSLKYLFYVSQFRPSKNILTLLRAYHHLLVRGRIGHKLILTGDLSISPQINSYITDNKLHNDVLSFHELSNPELAACYKLADLAVNPTLSEGGFPFTFCEALSVDTPIVMSKIPVTEEIITEPALQEMMLFDPYRWESLAERIEWALLNRVSLLQEQQKLYQKLSQRNWCDVVNEYINILDRISSGSLEKQINMNPELARVGTYVQ